MGNTYASLHLNPQSTRTFASTSADPAHLKRMETLFFAVYMGAHRV